MRTSQTMKLENQKVSKDRLTDAVQEKAEEIKGNAFLLMGLNLEYADGQTPD